LLKKKLFASWDRFMVPYPWSRGFYLWGAPIWVPRDADEQALAAACQDLEAVLNRLTDQAEKAVKRET
jgi:lysophospholipid acyltransferase (LPLAT)-like uncharacterized protein